MAGEASDTEALPAETAVGRVALAVDDLDRIVPFYRDAIGCRVVREGSTARLRAADDHDLLVFEEGPGAAPRPATAAGLYHAAIRLPDRAALGDALARVRDADVRLVGASDHLVSEALYFQDPAGNGLELYRDRPRASWSRLDDGRVEMDTLPLDLDELLSAATGAARDELPAGTDVGHVHLESTELTRSTEFYDDGLGLRPSANDYPGARFFAAGGYHHHVAINVWQHRRDSVGDHQGLRWFELVLPDGPSLEAAVDRLDRRGFEVTETDGTWTATDPDGIEVRFGVGG